MNLRSAAVILILVALPAVVFAVAESSRGPAPPIHIAGLTFSSPPSPTQLMDAMVARFKQQHPGADCTVHGLEADCSYASSGTSGQGQIFGVMSVGTPSP